MQDHRAAVSLQLEHGLPGVRVRCRKEDRKPLVDRLAARVAEGAQAGPTRRGQRASQGLRDIGCTRSGDAYDADSAAPGVAMAAIVSRAAGRASASGMGSFVAIKHALNLPLLCD